MRLGGVARVGGDFVVLSLVCGVSAFSVWFATFPRSKFGLVGASARSTCLGHVCARGIARVWGDFVVLSLVFSEQAHAARAKHVCACVRGRAWFWECAVENGGVLRKVCS